MSRVVQAEVSAAMRELLSSIPPHGASSQARVDWHLRKAEVLDFVAATHPQYAAQAMTLALRARSEARAISSDY